MAFDWFLVIVAVAITAVFIVGIGILIIYFGHPDDSNAAYFPKVVVLLSLYFACMNVMLLPLDVASGQTGGELDMAVAWDIAVWVTASLLFFVIPFAYFFYENDVDEEEDTSGCCGLVRGYNGQLCEGLKWAFGFLVSFALVLVLMWLFLHFADIPVRYRTYNFNSADLRVAAGVSPDTLSKKHLGCNDKATCASSMEDIEITVTIGVFLMAMLSFLGWALFVVFAGLGLVMLPADLFMAWKNRPTPVSLQTYAKEKRKLGERARLLREAGAIIKNDQLAALTNKPGRKQRRENAETFHRFENAVYMIKRDFFHLETAYRLRGGNPFVAWFKLLIAIVGGSISLMWVIHVCVFVLPDEPAHPMLNNLFIALSIPGFPLAGVAAFACYTFWLLAATMKGNFRFGLRIAFCRAFPMEHNNTMVNSFLANSWLILICSWVVVQFSAISFPVYARNSTIDLIFGTQIKYLRFFTYFFLNNVFVYALIVFVALGVAWQLMCPRNEAVRIEKELQGIIKGKKNINQRELQKISSQ